MISLRFVAGGDLISKMVARAEYDFAFTHVEFVLDDGTFLGSHNAHGVAIVEPGYDAAWAIAARVAGIPATAEQTDALAAFLRAQLGKPYDHAAVNAFAADLLIGRRDWRQDDAWSCSELAAAALEAAGVIGPLVEDAERITPRDVMILVSARPDTVWLS